MTLEEILNRLDGVRGSGGKFVAKCPSHDDQNASLRISQGDKGGVVVKCFAGCTFDDIVAAMGLKKTDFSPEGEKSKRSNRSPAVGGVTLKQLANYKKLPVEFLKGLGLRDWNWNGSPAVCIPYRDDKNQDLTYQFRVKLKGDDKFRNKSGERVALYGLDNLADIKAAGWVLIVEGPSDRWTCSYHNVPCLAVPGKGNWQASLKSFPTWEEFFKGIDVFVWQEPEAETFSASIAKNLPDSKIIIAADFKDPSDAHVAGIDVAAYVETLKASAKTYGPPLTRDLIYIFRDFITRFVFFKDERVALLIAAWTVCTYIYLVFDYFGILWINSPTLRCGKTRLVEIEDKLVFKSSGMNINVSPPALFRMTADGCTFLADEVENLKTTDKEEYGTLMAIFNAGFSRGATVPRAEKSKHGWVVKRYNVYGPKVLAGISSVTETIRDRSFSIKMTRQSKTEKRARLKMRKEKSRLESMRSAAKVWAAENGKAIQQIYDSMTEDERLGSCDDRFIDIAEPLVAILKFADAESANGGTRILDEVMLVLLELGGQRDESQNDEAIAALCIALDQILGSDREMWISSAKLLEKTKETDGIKWIASQRSLSTFMSKLNLYSLQFRDEFGKQRRGYRITRAIIDDIKSRYASAYSESEASQASQGYENKGVN
jgi:Protein of unknown function (DUF3631)